jgi:hypothetical protein
MGQTAEQRRRDFRRFEAYCVGPQNGFAVGIERRCVGVDECGCEALQECLAYIQQPCAARAAQGLAAWAGQDVAAEFGHVDRHLPKRLRRVDEVRDAMTARDLADRCRRIDEAAVRRHPGQCDQPDPLVEHRLQCAGVDGAAAIGRNRFDGYPRALGRQAHGGQIAAPFVTRNQNAIAGLPCAQRGERAAPALGVAARIGDLRGLGIHQPGG